MKKTKTIRKVVFYAYTALILITNFITPIYAANDPVTVVNNFSDFLVGLSLKSHDPSQRSNGFMTVAGGIIITFAKEILNIIVG